MSHKARLTEQAFTMIDILYEHGINEIVISPGSRSTPLAIAAEIHPHIKTYVHPDERSAAFFAIGLHKGSLAPIGLICTSGTAASNYTPAVSEAKYANIPLVVITADRPAELRNIGAPQTMNQSNMFQNFVQYYHEFHITHRELNSTTEIESVIHHTAHYFKGQDKGPVHINIQIDEPLLPDLTQTSLFHREQLNADNGSTSEAVEVTTVKGRGLILLGATCENLSESVEHLSTLNIPIIADPRQSAHKISHVITNHDILFSYILNHKPELLESIDFVIRVGDPFTSKSTNQLLGKLPSATTQIYFSEYADLKTFPKLPSESFVGQVNRRLKQVVGVNIDSLFYEVFYDMNQTLIDTLKHEVVKHDDEGRFTYELINAISNTHAIFVSNSMPIRDVERYDTRDSHDIYANRGVNGIDGVTSTALGMAVHKKITLIIGDLAFYHDMNGLLMAKLEDIDINIIIFNNNGGGIFNFLPQHNEPAVFERLFGTPMNISFHHAAELYGFKYARITEVRELPEHDFNKPGRNIFEVITDRTQNLEAHEQLKEAVFEAVSKHAAEL